MFHTKYFLDLLKFNWQRIKAYPVRLIISISWVIFGFIPQFFFWYIISMSTNTLPYSTKQIVLYFLFSMGLFYNLNHINDHFRRIATGDIVTNVIKPMSLTTNYFMIFFTTIFMNKLPNLIIIGIIGSIIISIKTTIFSFAFFILGLILGCMFFVVLFLAMFWFRNNWGIKWGVDIMIMFSSGTWVPLDVMPKTLNSIIFLFPFHLMFFTPAKIFLGQYVPTFWLFAQYVIWIIVFYIIARILEYFGLKYYEQLGG